MGKAVYITILATLLCALLSFHSSSLAKGKSRAQAIAPLTAKGMPNVQSASAVVYNAKSGRILFSKKPNAVRSIASTTKIFVAMVVQNRKIDLQSTTTITKEDANYAKGGARTRLNVGQSFRNQDLLRAMLIASDNRAPTALARAVNLTPKGLIREMNRLAKKLGLRRTKFTDPSGLHGNTSTAKEMSKALAIVMRDPFLAKIMATKQVTIRGTNKRAKSISYRNTNISLHTGTYTVLGGKTGFTTKAGYCLLIDVKLKGQIFHMAFLGAKQKLTRFGDFGRVAQWILAKK